MTDTPTLDKGTLPDWMHKDLKQIVDAAVALGWQMHLSSDSVAIHSVRGNKRWVFTAGRRSTYPIKRIKREVAKYADPKIAELVILGNEIKDPSFRQLISDALPKIGDADVTVDHTDEEEQALREREEKVKAAQTASHPTLVSQTPMLAKRQEGRGYESPTTVERLWSDGSKDYACVECGWTSLDRVGPSRHYGQTHSKGKETVRPASFTTEVPEAAHYRPQRRRVEALAALLQEAEDEGVTDWVEFAEKALSWVHEQSKRGTGEAAEREPMTAEETIERIRLLLDDGTMTRHTETVANLEKQVLELRQERDAFEATAREARETLEALHELTATATKAG
jgi:hypothetical protein